MQLAIFQPDIPQNLGTLIRTCACMGAQLHIIEPCGFILDDKRLRRAHMDYIDHLEIIRHKSWDFFVESVADSRIVLLTTKASDNYLDFEFKDTDILLLGSESSGAPDYVHARADGRVKVNMKGTTRSLNVAISGAIVLSEALRQTSP